MRPKTDAATSARLGRIRQRNTGAELLVRRLLTSIGCKYRLNVRSLAGTPDISNRERRWAVFVNGCYWHHHKGCIRATVPKSNNAFWKDKFTTNRRRDARNLRALRRSGFQVFLVWECQLEDESLASRRFRRFIERCHTITRDKAPPVQMS
jgi:DNA mismatch endonuclease (patch repair protein)